MKYYCCSRYCSTIRSHNSRSMFPGSSLNLCSFVLHKLGRMAITASRAQRVVWVMCLDVAKRAKRTTSLGRAEEGRCGNSSDLIVGRPRPENILLSTLSKNSGCISMSIEYLHLLYSTWMYGNTHSVRSVKYNTAEVVTREECMLFACG
jgi:hypothetical protein